MLSGVMWRPTAEATGPRPPDGRVIRHVALRRGKVAVFIVQPCFADVPDHSPSGRAHPLEACLGIVDRPRTSAGERRQRAFTALAYSAQATGIGAY